MQRFETNIEQKGVHWRGKRPSKVEQTCTKGVVGSISGMISGSFLGALVHVAKK